MERAMIKLPVQFAVVVMDTAIPEKLDTQCIYMSCICICQTIYMYTCIIIQSCILDMNAVQCIYIVLHSMYIHCTYSVHTFA